MTFKKRTFYFVIFSSTSYGLVEEARAAVARFLQQQVLA